MHILAFRKLKIEFQHLKTSNYGKKIYQEPTMKVVLLKQRAHLLVGSELNDPEDYSNEGDPFSN